MGPPGNLWVTMSPKPSLTNQRFTNWYNNTHGPDRLSLPFIHSGRRYRCTDGESPEYVATYEVSDMDLLNSPPYLHLREHPSKEEQEILPQINIDRFLYEQEISIGEVNATDKVPYLMMTLRITIPDENDEAVKKDLHAWYIDEHIPMLAKIPGWLRSRRFKVIDTAPESALQGHGKVHWFATHEYTREHGVGGKEFNDARQTVWRMKIMANAKHVSWRNWELFYEFGPLPRDLAAKGVFAPRAVIESEFPLSGEAGEKARYRLEGSTDPEAPLIVFSNSFMTDWHIWDEFIKEFAAVHPQFRFVRYNQRSYAPYKGKGKDEEITIDVLAADVAALLDGLLVRKAHAIVGVSLGGATALKFALKYPERISRFVAADFRATSPPSAAGAWAGRAILAEKQGMKALGEQNVARWFLPKNLKSKGAQDVVRMVSENDLEAFKKGTNALVKLDLEKELPKCEVKGLFVAGLCDSMIPLVMERYPGQMKKAPGSAFEAVPDAGHLPMVENVMGFFEKVATFLGV